MASFDIDIVRTMSRKKAMLVQLTADDLGIEVYNMYAFVCV